MRRRMVTIPELAMIAGTRAAVGAGLGLLLASRIPSDTRRAIGWTLLAIGAISTIPLIAEILQSDAVPASLAGGTAAAGARSQTLFPE